MGAPGGRRFQIAPDTVGHVAQQLDLAVGAGGQRFLVSQDENSRAGQRVRLPSFNVDRYSRFNEGPSGSS